MKIEFRDDSLRLRLTQKEVSTLRESGRVEAEIRFSPETALRYALASDAGVEAPTASFADGCVEVRLPPSAADQWTGSDDVGVEAFRSTGEGRELRILVEKDFKCLTARPEEDDSDAFANPLAEHEAC